MKNLSLLGLLIIIALFNIINVNAANACKGWQIDSVGNPIITNTYTEEGVECGSTINSRNKFMGKCWEKVSGNMFTGKVYNIYNANLGECTKPFDANQYVGCSNFKTKEKCYANNSCEWNEEVHCYNLALGIESGTNYKKDSSESDYCAQYNNDAKGCVSTGRCSHSLEIGCYKRPTNQTASNNNCGDYNADGYTCNYSGYCKFVPSEGCIFDSNSPYNNSNSGSNGGSGNGSISDIDCSTLSEADCAGYCYWNGSACIDSLHNVEADCNGVFDAIQGDLQAALNAIRIIGPLLVGVYTVLDFLKAVTQKDADALKKAGQKLLKRVILIVLLFFLPILVELLLSFLDSSITTCVD